MAMIPEALRRMLAKLLKKKACNQIVFDIISC